MRTRNCPNQSVVISRSPKRVGQAKEEQDRGTPQGQPTSVTWDVVPTFYCIGIVRRYSNDVHTQINNQFLHIIKLKSFIIFATVPILFHTYRNVIYRYYITIHRGLWVSDLKECMYVNNSYLISNS